MKKKSVRAVVVSLIILAVASVVVYFIFKRHNTKEKASAASAFSNSESSSSLLSIENLDDFYYEDKSRDEDLLSEKKTYLKKVKSIKLSRFSTTYQKMLLEKELFFDFNGKLIKKAYYSSESTDTAFVYPFYNDRGKVFLEVSIGSNKYDTTYTLRNFDPQNHIKEEIQYNIKRNELNEYTTRNIKLLSDSVLRVEETTYEHDMTTNNILPYYVRDMYLTLINSTEVNVHTNRTVCQDTAYNSKHDDAYILDDQNLVSVKNNVEYEYNPEGDWITMKGDGFLIKREINFYNDKEPQITKGFNYDKPVLDKLDSMMQRLSTDAWKNHRQKHNEIASKTKLYNEGNYGKNIEVKEANTIDEFTPVLWYVVSKDSGSIEGIDGNCVVVGYNTPLKDQSGSNSRCLAIYERVGNKYKLRKESFNALETFTDYDDDFSFHDFNEANFSIQIEEGDIVVSYGYMRGEAGYTYAYESGNWVLVKYESNHRTCCESEVYSYDYRTKEYSASIYSTSEEESRDTSYTVKQDRPIMYMDSMNVWQFDYDETGLLIK